LEFIEFDIPIFWERLLMRTGRIVDPLKEVNLRDEIVFESFKCR
jgi:hypothetical protein